MPFFSTNFFKSNSMKKRFHYILIFFCFFSYAQQTVSENAVTRKEISASKVEKAPKIDGILDDEVWKNIPTAKDFIERSPENGKQEPQDHKTFVKVLYDDTGVYFGFEMLDPHPENIAKEVTERDNIGTDDAVGITINGYNDKQQAVLFIVQASGVQADSKLSANSSDDFTWNAVWYSAVKINDNGWSAEIKIPYSELRFPKNNIQTWGINFIRLIQKTNQNITWNHVDNKKGGYLLYDGILKNIENINPPIRLSFLPYFSTYVNNYDGKTTNSINGGMDVKYGINDAFTLDTTLIPDFGQTNFDPTVLNLTPFEQQYEEQRSFFTEGTELFSKGNLFYSRRIGGAPSGSANLNTNETLLESPSKVKLLNATKISGRTNKGLGIGFFNGITENTYATIHNDLTGENRKELIEPLANYNVFVLDQRFRDNSSVSLVNSNTMRSGDYRDANVTAVLYDVSNKKNTYRISGGTKGSWIFDQENKFGLNTWGGFNKTSGKHRFGSTLDYVDKNYNADDLGYTGPTNYFAIYNNYSYRFLQPKGNINNLFLNINVNHKRRIEPQMFYRFNINTNLSVTNKKFQSYGGGFYATPFGEKDIYEPRTFGRHLNKPVSFNYWLWYESDSRKKFYYNIYVGQDFFNEKARQGYDLELTTKYRFSDHFSIILTSSYNRYNNAVGFAGNNSSTGEIFMGRRDVRSIVNSLTSQYTFNDKMMVNLAFRHYFSDVAYQQFYTLQSDGNLLDNPVYRADDTTFNSWNLDLRYSWWFAPGSQLTLMYRNAASNYLPVSGLNYRDNINRLFNEPIANNISLRITYYLDYNRAKAWFSKK